MTTTINASATNGLVTTADGSGVVKLQSNGVTTNSLAWANFNGTTVSPSTIRSSYNISSVTKNGTGDYTVNFANALSDANYSATGSGARAGDGNNFMGFDSNTYSTTALRNYTKSNSATNTDMVVAAVMVFGN